MCECRVSFASGQWHSGAAGSRGGTTKIKYIGAEEVSTSTTTSR